MTNEQIVDRILDEREGSTFTNRSSDRGGPTKWGVTLAAWRDYTGRPDAAAIEIQQLTREQARAFFLDVHVQRPRFDAIDDELLRDLVIDAGVNHGTRAATLWLQEIAGVVPDGNFGPVSQAAVNKPEAAAPIFLRFLAKRIRKFGQLVSRDARLIDARRQGFALQAENAEGWNNRAADFLVAAAAELTRG